MSEDLIAENARLAARVAELEAQLAAKPPIDRLSLYRMVNQSPWGVLALNLEGRLDFANPALQRWMLRPAPAIGERTCDAVIPALLAQLNDPIAEALEGVSSEIELTVRDRDGQSRHVRLNIIPRGAEPQSVNGVIISLYDVTETQALDRSVRENEARLLHINAVTPSANYIYDFETGMPSWVAGRADVVFDFSPEEMDRGGLDLIKSIIHPDDFPKVFHRLGVLAKRPDGDVVDFELRVRRRDGSYRWILDRAVIFERDAEGRIIKTLSAAIDIDERKRAEERRTMLINELNHRVKNTLAAVQSIARQTLRPGRPPQQAVELFTNRLVALSAAHDVLTRQSWEGADLQQIVDGALQPFQTPGDVRISVAGPNVRLNARAALALAMALHELATNAAKYGALSRESGRVALDWAVDAGTEPPTLNLTWCESGGPAVTQPQTTGFGSRLLTQGLPGELGGSATLDYQPDGLTCRILAPLAETAILELA